jgi:hypothetical protein
MKFRKQSQSNEKRPRSPRRGFSSIEDRRRMVAGGSRSAPGETFVPAHDACGRRLFDSWSATICALPLVCSSWEKVTVRRIDARN